MPPWGHMWHAARCWQPWGSVGYSRMPVAQPPCAGRTQLLCILQSVLGETCGSPIITVPHRHNCMGCGSQLPEDEGVMLGSPSPHTRPSWDACASAGCLWGPVHRRDTFPAQTVGLKQTKRNSGKISGEPRWAGDGG